MVTTQNWTFSCFENSGMKSFISFGMAPGDEDMTYFVTVIENDDKELYQETCTDLDHAVKRINQKYHGTWEYKNLTLPTKKDSGCSSCVAH